MGSMLAAEVRAAGILAEAAPVVAMVSGGRDSTCLLDVLAEICGAEHVFALHVNYGLRGAASEADEHHVRALCADLGIECNVVHPRRGERGGNLHGWARAERYGHAGALADRHAALIATGHTATDQVETMLYRLAASPGRRGLLAMRARHGRVLRPLLAYTRAQTAEHCRARGLAWREDASNDDERFARARVRHGLLEDLRAIHPAAEANVLRTLALLRDEASVLEDLVDAILEGHSSIPIERLAALPAALGRLVLVRLAEEAAGSGAAEVAGRLEELLELAGRARSAECHLGGGVRAVLEQGVLRFRPLGETPAPEAAVLGLPGRLRFGAWNLEGEIGTLAQAPAAGAGVALLDLDALGTRRLRVQGWQTGDRVRPLGLGGVRSLADVLGERRVPRAERPQTPVVWAGEEVAWVPAVVRSELCAVGPGTRRVAVLRARRHTLAQ